MATEDPFDDDAHAEGSPDSFDAMLRSAARTPQVLRAGAGLAGGRFQIVRALGRGGMGVVYEVLDATRSGRVALKTLTRCGPQEIYRLKNEFRSLADVAHPNLVALHEIVRDGELWFFTMDLHEGENFLSYVRGHEPKLAELAETRAAGERMFDAERLRDALRQLVEGVVALHRAGKLHCDLKPANVIVSKTGQLTILDFGLVSERVGPSTGHTLGNEWGGTPGYMAPEQMSGGPLSPASDYYAIGVMLYESLTGGLPFRPAPGSLLPAADRTPVTLPAQVVDGDTADLAALCLDLLAIEPSARPSEESLLARACRYKSAAPRPSVPSARDDTPFLGREAELAQLLTLRERLEAQRPSAVLIRGPSGIGKTRLAQEFLRGLREASELVLLEGRCYERESLPYNAFDSLIDALSRYLRRLPELRAAALMPRDARVLAELFPVLRRVPSLDAMPATFGSRADPSDPLRLRRRAFDALKELLSRISDFSPLVLCIDDLQWADADSLQLLEALFTEPAAPRMLLVGLCLSEHTATAEAIAGLCERHKVALTDLALAPLPEPARLALISEQLALPAADAARMAQESQGNPFFLGELIAVGGVSGASADLRAVILERAARLSPGMRGLLDLLCVAGAPLDFGLALGAAELAHEGQGLVTELRNERWLRLDPSGKSQRIEIYHDRIRSVLSGALDDAQARRLRRRLAECLEARPGADEELVASHWLAAGASERAAQGFARAASRADKNLAFVAAGRLYGLALEHGRFAHAECQRLRLAMALAFERGGHALSAAEAYLAAARAASESGDPDAGSEALALRRSAAQLFLASGALDAGLEVLREVLAEVGLDYPARPDQALALLAVARGALEARGLTGDLASFEPEPSGSAGGSAALSGAPLERARRKADACWAAGPTLGSYDFVRGGYFATEGLLLALDTGDALRIARGLAMVATSLASGGEPELARVLAERARVLAERAGDATALANAELVLGQVSLFAGDFAHCLAASDRALSMFRGLNAGESLEVHLCNMFANMALHLSGRIDELVRRSREQLADARDRGHIQAEASLRVLGVALGHLLADDVTAAREQGEISARLWPQERFHAERFKVLRLGVWCDLYEGRGEAAFARFAEARGVALESLLLSSRYWSYWWYELALNSALAAAAAVPEGGARYVYLAEAEQAVLKLESMQPSYVAPQLAIYRAARARLVGDRQGALDGLRALCGVAHPLLSACAQLVLGTELGGPEGAAVAQLGLRGLGERVSAPARWTAFMLPGFAASDAR